MNKHNYIDMYGRIHDKVCFNNQYSSNNGWFYSAVYLKLGGHLNIDMNYAIQCAMRKLRHLDKPEPPISRDEILGLVYLGAMTPHMLKDWNFSPYDLPKLNLHMLFDQLHECVGKHRNHFWQNRLEQVYHLAFMVPFQDRHFINKQFKEFNFIYFLIEKIDKLLFKPENNSGHLIRFLKYDIMPNIEVFEKYFGVDHPITIQARSRKADAA